MPDYSLSVEDAIAAAKRKIKWPSMAAMLLPLLGFILAGKLQLVPTIGYAGMYWFLPIFLVGFITSWLIWSFRVPKWMLWAYPQVQSITALKKAAVAEHILWPDGSLFNRTLIMSRSERDQLARMEQEQ